MRASIPVGVRFIRACGVLVMFVTAASVLECSRQVQRPGVLSETVRFSVADLFAGGEEALEERGGEAIPPEFEEEVLLLAGRRDVRVAAEGRVVGFVSGERPEVEFASLSAMLETHGWTPVASGLDTGGSFAKGEGVYVWAFVSCVETGAGTSVIVNCAMAGEEG